MTNKTTALATLTNKLAAKFDMGENGGELVSVLKQTAFKGNVSDAQLAALMVVANQYGLNPWTKEIYAFPDKNNGIVPVVGVDGWSRIINDHPQFDGMDFEQDDEKCTCVIYRKDRSHAIRVTEYMAECRRENVTPWKSHPRRMLRHKALIQCARIAFGFVGIYDEDEAERITEKDITPPKPAIAMPKATEAPVEVPQANPIEGDFIPADVPQGTPQSYIAASAKQLKELRARLGVYGVAEQALLDEFFLEALEQLPADKVAEASRFIKANATVKSA